MKTLQELCKELNVNINTLRYHLKKNRQDYDDGIYFINLNRFVEAQPLFRGGMLRKFYCIEDEYNFKHQYLNYVSWIENNRVTRKNSSVRWNESSIQCWKLKGNCSGCSNYSICMKVKDEPPFPMMDIVEKLLKEIGEPYLIYKT